MAPWQLSLLSFALFTHHSFRSAARIPDQPKDPPDSCSRPVSSSDECTPKSFCPSGNQCRRYAKDIWCCCPEDPKHDPHSCRLNPYLENGTKCQRWCCDTNKVTCGNGCCEEGEYCGWNFSSHEGRNFECCTYKEISLEKQDSDKCCAWGVGQKCTAAGTPPCCVKCLKPQSTSGQLYCPETDPTYECQRNCSDYKPPLDPVVYVTAGSVALCFCACSLTVCLCRGRCKRRHPSQESLLEPASSSVQEIGLATAALAEVAAQVQWFFLLIAVPVTNGYGNLDIVLQELQQLKRILAEVVLTFDESHVLEVSGAEANEEGILQARQVLLNKLAKTKGAHVFFWFGGHGHARHMIAADGRFVPIDKFFADFRLCNRVGITCARSIQPQVVAFFDCCRTVIPQDAPGASYEQMIQDLPRKTDGRVYYVFATEHGHEAVNGRFTPILIRMLDIPGLTLAELVDQINIEMERARFQRVEFAHNGDKATTIVIHAISRMPSSSTVGSPR